MSRVPPLRFIEPQLASLADEPPEGKHWIHEIKHDGYRCQLLIEPDRVRMFTRNGHDWTDRFSSIARAARALECKSAILDGEAVIQDESGVSDFEALRSAIHARSPNIILYAFDLLHLDGRDIRQQMLSDRRTLLKRLVGDDAESRIQVSDEFDGGGAALFAACRDMGLEGIVSKHAMAPYRQWSVQDLAEDEMFHQSRHSWSSAQIGIERLARSVPCLLTLTAKASVMPGRHSSLLLALSVRSFSPKSNGSPRVGPRSNRHG